VLRPLNGRYCAACGQKADALDPSLRDGAHEAVHEFLHVDTKFVRSVKLLFARPGAVLFAAVLLV